MPDFARDALGLLEGPVEEIVRAFDVAAVHHVGGMQTGRQHLALGHEAALHHIGQHLIGAGASGGKVDMRRIFGGRLEQAGEHRRLGERQILDALAEIEVGRGGYAESAAAHIGAVEIELQDLFLGQVHLQPQRKKASLTLRSTVRSLDRNRFLASCWVIVDPPWTTELARTFSCIARIRPRKSMPKCSKKRRSSVASTAWIDVVRHLVDRDGIALDDAALPDLVAVAVEEGDGEIILCAPVSGCFLESGHRQRQHDHRACGAQCEAFAQELDRGPAPAGDAEAAEEDRQCFPISPARKPAS